MYDQAPDALLAFWVGLRGPLRGLSSPSDLEAHWLSPATLLTQTCGYPLATALADRVRLVGTPRYAARGCRGSDYASLIVVRRGDAARTLADLRGRRAAVNGRHSQSGYNAFRALVAPLAHEGRFFAEVIETGGHARSLRLIREDQADVASIDCVTHAMMARSAPQLVEGLRVLCLSDPAPGLPLITARATTEADLARLRSAFAAACADPRLASARRVLLLDGLDVRPVADYGRCTLMEESAKRLGYLDIA